MSVSTLEESIIEEANLLSLMASGDLQAFEKLYALYSTPLFSLGVRMLSRHHDAEEALQDAFVKIWQNAAFYDARKARPFTWAVTIMKRTCIDKLRKNKREYLVEPIESEQGVNLAIAESVRKSTELHEAKDQVVKALEAVPVKQKQALELALFSGMTHAEIAATMEQPLGTVKSWLKRGLFQLRNTLSKPLT